MSIQKIELNKFVRPMEAFDGPAKKAIPQIKEKGFVPASLYVAMEKRLEAIMPFVFDDMNEQRKCLLSPGTDLFNNEYMLGDVAIFMTPETVKFSNKVDLLSLMKDFKKTENGLLVLEKNYAKKIKGDEYSKQQIIEYGQESIETNPLLNTLLKDGCLIANPEQIIKNYQEKVLNGVFEGEGKFGIDLFSNVDIPEGQVVAAPLKIGMRGKDGISTTTMDDESMYLGMTKKAFNPADLYSKSLGQ